MKKTILLIFALLLSVVSFSQYFIDDQNIYIENGNITANSFNGEFTQANSIKRINDISDFPTPVDCVITLENYHYILNDTIYTYYSFKPPVGKAVKMSSTLPIDRNLIYLSDDTLFKGSDYALFNLENISIINAVGGAIFGLKNSTQSSIDIIQNCQFISAENIGYIKKGICVIQNTFIQDFSDGIIFDSCETVTLSIVDFTGDGTGATYVTLDNYLSNSDVHLCSFNTTLLDTALNINILPANAMNVSNCTFGVGGKNYTFNSYNFSDNKITFNGNSRAENSQVTAEVKFFANGLTTSTPATAVPTFINVSTWTNQTMERMSSDANGITKYTGLENITLKVFGSAILDVPLGNTKILNLFLGGINAYDSTSCTFQNANDSVLADNHGFSNGDLISFYDSEGTLPSELRTDCFYYIVQSTTNSFKLSYTSGGGVVSFTDDGSGLNDFSEAFINGVQGRVTVNTGDPQQATTFGLFPVKTGVKGGLMISRDDDTDIDAIKGGLMITN